MKRLLFHLWYDNEAREAVQFYSTVFSNCQLRHHYVLEDTPFRPGRTDRLYAGRPIPGSFECRPFFST